MYSGSNKEGAGAKAPSSERGSIPAHGSNHGDGSFASPTPAHDGAEDVNIHDSDGYSPEQSPTTAIPSAEDLALVDRNKMFARIGYVGMYGGMSAATPFYGLLLSERGFSKDGVGAVMALQPLCTLVVLSPAAYIADRFHCGDHMITGSAGISSFCFAIVTLLSTNATKAVIVIFMLCHFVSRTVLTPFYDQHSLAILPKDRKTEWGALRSFGGIGWGAFAPIASALVDLMGWPMSALLLIIGMSTAMFCYHRMRPLARPKATEKRFAEVVKYALQHFRIVLFLIAECFMGLGYSLIGTFLFIFLDSLGAPKFLMGISLTMTVLVEIPLFQISNFLHARFTDRQLLAISMVAWAVRVLGYSLLENPWLVLFLEPLHGLTFGLMWISGIHFVSHAFPPSLSHSANGFLSSAAFGVGPVIGNICGGIAYKHMGPRWMFRCMAGVMAILGVIFYLCDHYLASKGYSILAKEEVGPDGEGGAAVDVVIVDSSSPTEAHKQKTSVSVVGQPTD